MSLFWQAPSSFCSGLQRQLADGSRRHSCAGQVFVAKMRMVMIKLMLTIFAVTAMLFHVWVFRPMNSESLELSQPASGFLAKLWLSSVANEKSRSASARCSVPTFKFPSFPDKNHLTFLVVCLQGLCAQAHRRRRVPLAFSLLWASISSKTRLLEIVPLPSVCSL